MDFHLNLQFSPSAAIGEAFPFFVFIAIGGLLIALFIYGHMREKKRREAFAQLAARLNLRYYPNKDYGLAQRYQFLDKMRQGDNRYAYNLIEGEYVGHPVQAFDYHYQTYSTDSKGKRQTDHHRLSVFVLDHRHRFPELHIYPENIFSKFGQMLGYDDIDFESEEFSRAFCVRSADKKFAYDIVHTRMMEYLLRHPDLTLEIEGPCMAMCFGRRLKPDEIEPRLRQLVEIRDLFPEYLYQA